MSRSHLAWLATGLILVGGSAQAQCRGGGGSSSSGGTSTAGSTVAGTSGATLLSGPGSLAYDIAAQMYQQRLLQQRYAMVMQQSIQQQAARQQQLAARRERADKTRTDLAAKRQRTYAYLASKNGGSRSSSPPSYVAANWSGGR